MRSEVRPRRFTKRPAMAVAAITAVTALITTAGCSGTSGNTADATGVGSGAKADVKALGPGTKNVPKENPVEVGVLYTDDNPLGIAPEILDGAEAAAQYVNSHGGVGGRAVKIVACNGKNNSQSNAQCAAKFVNSGVVTVYGLDALWGDVGVSVAAKAGLASQTMPISGPEFAASNSYAWQGSGFTASAAAASYIADQKVVGACAYVDVPAFKEQCVDYFQKPARQLGAKTSVLAIPPGASDVSQYATRLSQTHAKTVLVTSSGQVAQQLIKSSAQTGYRPQWILPSQRADFFKALGSQVKGVIFYNDLVDSSDPGNRDAAIFRAAIAKWAPHMTVNAFSTMAFSNIVTLARLGNQVGGDKITRAGLPSLLAKVKDLPQFMGPTLDSDNHLPGFPHALHTGAYLYQWDGSTYKRAGKGYYTVPGSTG
ncbi:MULTISPECIES: ABC transporter substrate-binding protein [unclassified Streptomyces]|uniref:ABC transporter substrate-binding protein n=1 Tax=unclassified Streptomyces TaxID=2593676 RepID=UPI00362ADBC1